MRRHTSPNRPYLWTCAAVTVALALGVPAAAAKECRRETPLPADTRLITPSRDVPETQARFAGAWAGAWKTPTGGDALCHTLVVEEVFPNALPVSSTATGPTRAGRSASRSSGAPRAASPMACSASIFRRSTAQPSSIGSEAGCCQARSRAKRITPDGSYCRTWNVRDGGRERCYAVYRDGETFDLHMRDRWGTVSLRRTAGNPERY